MAFSPGSVDHWYLNFLVFVNLTLRWGHSLESGLSPQSSELCILTMVVWLVFTVNLTQPRVTRKEEPKVKGLPLSDWWVGRSVGHLLDC